MIHFYISLTRHPTSPARTGDTLLVFLITSMAIWIFHRLGASGPNGAALCTSSPGYREIKGQWWAGRWGGNVELRHFLRDGGPIPLKCFHQTKLNMMNRGATLARLRLPRSAAFTRVWMMTWFPYTKAEGLHSQNDSFYLYCEGCFRRMAYVLRNSECSFHVYW